MASWQRASWRALAAAGGDLVLAWAILQAWVSPGDPVTLPFRAVFGMLLLEAVWLGVEPLWAVLALRRPDGTRVLPGWAVGTMLGGLTLGLGAWGRTFGATLWPVGALWVQAVRAWTAPPTRLRPSPPWFWIARWLGYLGVLMGSLALPDLPLARHLPPAPSPAGSPPLTGFWAAHPEAMYAAGVLYFLLSAGLRGLQAAGTRPPASA